MTPFEVVKTAAILDTDLFEVLESVAPDLSSPSDDVLSRLVAPTAAAKIRLVEQDPQESGQRRLLNFGHTLGHAIETALGYKTLRHGEAVGYRMLFALRLARPRGLSAVDGDRIESLIRAVGLPPLPSLDLDAVLAAMDMDKKNQEGGMVWVLPKAVGIGRVVKDLEMIEVREELEHFLTSMSAVTD